MLLLTTFKIPAWLKKVFLLLPLIEIAVFVIIAKLVGLGMALLLILFSTLLGMRVLSHLGMSASQMAMGQHTLDVTLRMMAGLLLVIPGFVTDIIGLLLLIPFIRKIIVLRFQSTTPQAQATSRVIEGECWRED